MQAALASRSSPDPGAPGVCQGSSDDGSGRNVEQAARTRGLIAERDAYLGRRIHESLRPGRTGILFLGLLHNVESYLAEDIVVTRLGHPVVPQSSTRPRRERREA